MNWEAFRIALLVTLSFAVFCVAFVGPGIILGFLFGPIAMCLWIVIVGLALLGLVVYVENNS